MNAIDLGVELGAKIYVFWGGREGTETDAAKDPIKAIERSRQATLRRHPHQVSVVIDSKSFHSRSPLFR